ncbi:hypothetical protein K469DRAFT_698714 [Zopfia rhizophila CBS 207.26]|uniref:Uncharacterized protein n=1 Tax=Zopfia rhizophila CBS 207.26 TaxID=1314779 RepID=A0A6A6EV41_9PEZI|nr:hypothetical protein K469DRAFT_698714 [Zopfia rhizophila CBS 207.26]
MTQPPTSNCLPYSSHPLYRLRLATIITAIIGLVFNLFAIAASEREYDYPPFITSLVLLFLSFVFCLHDLITYAVSKAAFLNSQPLVPAPATSSAHPRPTDDDGPQWPAKRLVVFDIIFAIAFQWLFWGEWTVIMSHSSYYYRAGMEAIQSYANLANFVASVLHAVAFWKELMARKRKQWRRDLEVTCENCGHVNETVEGPSASTATSIPAPAGAIAGPSGQTKTSIFGKFGSGKVALPIWAHGQNVGKYTDEERDVENDAGEGVNEEPLLVTPDESTTEVGGPSGSQVYGTLDQSVQSVDSVPETVVKKKGKGKKRLVEVE